MNESEIKYFTVSFQLKGRTEWFVYRIPHPDWERLRMLFIDRGPGDLDQLNYVLFRTSDRRSVVFRTNDVLAMRFLWDPLLGVVETEPEEEEKDGIRIFFSGQDEPLDIEPEDEADTFPFTEFIQMDAGAKRPFVSVVDIEGEDVMVNAAEVVLIEYPATAEGAAWDSVEKDMKSAFEQRDGESGKEDSGSVDEDVY